VRHQFLIIAAVVAALSWGIIGSGFVHASPSLNTQANTPIPPDTPTPIPRTATPTADERLTHIEHQLIEKSAVADIKDFIDILQSIVSIIAIVIGGWWGWRLYWQYRDSYPRATLELHLTHWLLKENERVTPDLADKAELDKKVLLHVKVLVKNVSKVMISVEYIKVQIRQIFPLRKPQLANELATHVFPPVVPNKPNSTEFNWPGTHKHYGPYKFDKGLYSVEPGETTEFYFDFALDAAVQTVSIYAYVKDVSHKGRLKHWLYRLIRKDAPEASIGWYTQEFYELKGSAGNKSNSDRSLLIIKPTTEE